MLNFLNLVIYSDNNDELYEEMFECMNQFYSSYVNHKDVNVKTIYMKYTLDKNILEDKDLVLKDNILFIKGNESFLPGVLLKTLSGFKYFEHELNNYDYIIRTNISTIIDFKLLSKELQQNPINFYGGGNKRILRWLGGGIKDSTWFGTEYIEGTSIIFTPLAVKHIIDNIHLIRTDLIDDLAFAIFIREHRPDVNVQNLPSKKYMFVPCFFENNAINVKAIREMVFNNEIIFYRNKCCNKRKIDVIQMNIIKESLVYKEKIDKKYSINIE